MITENLDQKIARLERTIDRCIYQINDTRNTPETIETFIRGKAEAEKQLAAARKEKAAQNKPVSETSIPNSATNRKTTSSPTGGAIVGEVSRKAAQPRSAVPNGPQNPAEGQHTHVVTAAPSQTLLVKIEWLDSEKEPLILGQGEVLSRLTVTLRDCAESQTVAAENWDKLVLSKQFRTLCLYYRAYAIFPRPSQEPLPAIRDIGEQYFRTAARKKIWELIRETVKPEVKP